MTRRKRSFVQALFAATIAPGCFPTDTTCEEVVHCYQAAPDASAEADSPSDGGPQGDRVTDASLDENTSSPDMDAPVVDVNAEPTCDSKKTPSEDACVIVEQYGVFVSPLEADAAADGSRSRPYHTIAAGLASAKLNRKRLYICDDGTGTGYAESITIDATLDGVQIFGGFSCSDWTYDTSRRALVRGPASPVLRIASLTSGAVVENIEIDAPDGVSPGDSSIAAIIDTSANVVLRRVKAVAGKAKDGASGVPASSPAMNGAPGSPGRDACSAEPNPGGATVLTICDGVAMGAGGKGGDGADGPPTAVAGGVGADGTPATDAGAGKGGQGEPLSGSWSCATGVGQPGDNGGDGQPGAGGAGPGALTATGWIGGRGADGQPGTPGQGGGGGGGARAPLTCPANDAGVALSTPTGASGASGAGGGCGGKGGQGGGAGGSSIAIVSLGSSLTLDTCDLVASDAGRGGDGAPGQRGGAGGGAVAGGHGVGTSKDACPGGIGGQGGNGGPGGGGAGGHSLVIAYTGTKPLRTSGTVTTAAAGVGGIVGLGGPPTSNGAIGIASADEQRF